MAQDDFRLSVRAQILALAGNVDGAQAVAFLDAAIDKAADFEAMRLRWLSDYLYKLIEAGEWTRRIEAAEIRGREAGLKAPRPTMMDKEKLQYLEALVLIAYGPYDAQRMREIAQAGAASLKQS